MRSWRDFWESKNLIYVSDVHRRVHDRHLFDSIVSILPDRRDIVVLDYGCGEALLASELAERVGRLLLFDASLAIRQGLATRYLDHPKIRVLAESDIGALEYGSVNVVIVNSVIQYIEPEEFRSLIRSVHRWLGPGGLMVLSDVISRAATAVQEAAAMLSVAARHGYLSAALKALAVNSVSHYGMLRRRIGLARYDETEILEVFEGAGFRARRLDNNFGLNQGRMTFIASRRGV